MMKEFKEFAMKGNLVDVAVAFVMGAAFNTVVKTFTGGIVSPLIGMIFKTDFSSLKWVLQEAIPAQVDSSGAEIVAALPEVAVMYGSFITAVLDFIIVAFVMFMIIKGIAATKKKEEEAPAAPPEPTKEEVLLTEIRDLLKK
ncbi:MAG: large-conductance mechanosensitive channel protein MscL [Flavobacteriales bacterium]|nr:large-conductance mechanosensitive channel protein MscL [Flavobacteriales bacterium]